MTIHTAVYAQTRLEERAVFLCYDTICENYIASTNGWWWTHADTEEPKYADNRSVPVLFQVILYCCPAFDARGVESEHSRAGMANLFEGSYPSFLINFEEFIACAYGNFEGQNKVFNHTY